MIRPIIQIFCNTEKEEKDVMKLVKQELIKLNLKLNRMTGVTAVWCGFERYEAITTNEIWKRIK